MKNKKIDDMLNNMVKDNVFPGATYLYLSKYNKYIGCVGNKSLFPDVKANNIETLYDMASLTKVIVTNTIIGRMLDQKRINLDDRVSKYLPKFKYRDITIYHLLTHSSGLPSDLDFNKITAKEEIIEKIYTIELMYRTGTKALYSDLGFILLGFIIEEIYQKPLDVVAESEIFIPLKMRDSCFNPIFKESCAPTEITTKRGVIRGIVHDEKSAILDGVAGHAGLFSSITDISKFGEMVLNNGYINGKKYLSKEVIDKWFLQCTSDDNKIKRSIGWIVGNDQNVVLNNNNVISHTGFTGTSVLIDRDNYLVFALLTNRIHPTRDNNLLLAKRKEYTRNCYNLYKEQNSAREDMK